MNTRTALLWHDNGAERLTLAVNPARIAVSRPNVNRVAALAMGGTVNLWGGRGLREVRLETFFPAEGSPFYRGTIPEAALAMLKRWQDSADPVRLIASGSDINDPFLIEDVTEILREGDGDVGAAVTLREYKFQAALTALGAGDVTGVCALLSPGRPDERPARGSYTVKAGDTLWDIACRIYGDGCRWGEIAEKNAATDPRRLRIGTVLTL